MSFIRNRFLILFAIVLIGCMAGSPSSAAKKLYKLMEAGEIEDAMELFSQEARRSTGDDKLRAVLRQAAREIDGKGGIKSFKVVNKKEIGEIAEIQFEIEYGNGEKTTEDLNLVKEDGRWKVEPEK